MGGRYIGYFKWWCGIDCFASTSSSCAFPNETLFIVVWCSQEPTSQPASQHPLRIAAHDGADSFLGYSYKVQFVVEDLLYSFIEQYQSILHTNTTTNERGWWYGLRRVCSGAYRKADAPSMPHHRLGIRCTVYVGIGIRFMYVWEFFRSIHPTTSHPPAPPAELLSSSLSRRSFALPVLCG